MASKKQQTTPAVRDQVGIRYPTKKLDARKAERIAVATLKEKLGTDPLKSPAWEVWREGSAVFLVIETAYTNRALAWLDKAMEECNV